MIYQCFTKGRGSKEFSLDLPRGSAIRMPIYIFTDINGKKEEVTLHQLPRFKREVKFNSENTYNDFSPKTMRKEDVVRVDIYNAAYISLTSRNASLDGFCYNKKVEFNLYNCKDVSIECRNVININSCYSVVFYSNPQFKGQNLNNVTIKKCVFLYNFFSYETELTFLPYKKKFTDVYFTNFHLPENLKKEFGVKSASFSVALKNPEELNKKIKEKVSGLDCFFCVYKRDTGYSDYKLAPVDIPKGYKLYYPYITTVGYEGAFFILYKSEKALQTFMRNIPFTALYAYQFDIYAELTGSKDFSFNMEWVEYPVTEFKIDIRSMRKLSLPKLKGFKSVFLSSGGSYFRFLGNEYINSSLEELDISSLELEHSYISYCSTAVLYGAKNLKKIRCKREIATAFIRNWAQALENLKRGADENMIPDPSNITWEYSD